MSRSVTSFCLTQAVWPTCAYTDRKSYDFERDHSWELNLFTEPFCNAGVPGKTKSKFCHLRIITKGENELSTSTDSFQREKEQISNSKSLKTLAIL